MKLVPKPTFSHVVIKKLWSKESKVFKISVVTKKPLVLHFAVTSNKSEISLPDSLIHLSVSYAVF